MGRDRALALGYFAQAATMGATAVVSFADAPLPIVYAFAAIAASSVTMTRPVHYASLPAMAETPDELTAANGLSTTLEGLATFAGPAVTGILLQVSGPGLVFAAMARIIPPATPTAAVCAAEPPLCPPDEGE